MIKPILEGTQDSETETQRKTREATNKEVTRANENAEEKRKFGEMRRNEADKKVKSILFLAGGMRRYETAKGENFILQRLFRSSGRRIC